MSTPVVTSKWAGNFDCSFCRRKRLTADEFSKSALDRHRRTGQILRCKTCTAELEQKEREMISAKAQKSITAATGTETSQQQQEQQPSDDETRVCAGSCQQDLPHSCYNRNQWGKGPGKSRCRACVEKSLKDEASQQDQATEDKIANARREVEELKARKAPTAEIVAAESELAALEAEKVTGLKPIRLGGRGGGRGRKGGGRNSSGGRGRCSGRGSGGK